MCRQNPNVSRHIFWPISIGEYITCLTMDQMASKVTTILHLPTMAPIPETSQYSWLSVLIDNSKSHRLLISLALCLLVITTLALWRIYRSRPKLQASQSTDPDRKDHLTSPTPMNNFYDYPFAWLPPPPGSAGLTHPYAQDDLFCVMNSGHLAARVEQRQRYTEATKSGPWRRRSYPPPTKDLYHDILDVDAQSVSESSVHTPSDLATLLNDDYHEKHDLIKSDTTLHFADPDLNGIWRRRVIEFAT